MWLILSKTWVKLIWIDAIELRVEVELDSCCSELFLQVTRLGYALVKDKLRFWLRGFWISKKVNKNK